MIEQAEIDRLLSDVPIGAVVNRYVTWDKAKKGWACCPFHQEKSPSFHVRHRVDGAIGGRFKCFGCGASGDVIDFLRAIEGISFPAAVEKLSGEPKRVPQRFAKAGPRPPRDGDPEKRAAALSVWERSEPIVGTLAEAYLRSRGIGCSLEDADLRFYPRVPHAVYSGAGPFYPAMVAAIRKPCGEFIGAHVTYLAADGSGKADVSPARKVYGKQDGGMIFLGRRAERMVTGEGVESSLSASEMCGRPAIAAVCSGNMKRMPLLQGVNDWLVAYDRDAHQSGYKAGKAFAERVFAAGLTVRALPPPGDCKDWNDAAQRRA